MFSLSSTAIVHATLWLLIVFSVVTWCIIFFKIWQQIRYSLSNRHFRDAFWSAADLSGAQRITTEESNLGRIAAAGFRALLNSRQANSRLQHSGEQQDILERSLRQQIQRERSTLEQGLTFLASIGSTAPFVGLFGTVWGIMNALRDISKAGHATLDVVAGPIGEALIATAIGIAVAIPAVLAYNFLLRRVKVCEADLEHFATDFLHLALRCGLNVDKQP